MRLTLRLAHLARTVALFVVMLAALPSAPNRPIAMTSAAAHPSTAAPRRLNGQTPDVVLNGTARLQRHHDPHETLTLLLGLRVRNSAQLDALIRAASDPTSPRYGRYLSPAQYLANFAPTDAEVAAVRAWAGAVGFSVDSASTDHLLVTVHAPAWRIEQVLALTLNDYSAQGRSFMANDRDASVPADLPIESINGLDTYARFEPLVRAAVQPANLRARCGPRGNGVYFSCYYPQDFANAYNSTPLADGTGQTIGVILWGKPTSAADLRTFAITTGTPALVPDQAGCAATTGSDANGVDFQCVAGNMGTLGTGNVDQELAMDIEYAHAMAPNSHIRAWLAACTVIAGTCIPTNDGMLAALSAAVNDPDVSVVSNSWGATAYPASFVVTANTLLQRAAALGKTFYVASGDVGSYTGADDFPTSSPYAVSVGGTALTTTVAGTYGSESGWSGSGGGCAMSFRRPFWQTLWQTSPFVQPSVPNCAGRAVPDVAADAAPTSPAFIYSDGAADGNWGTSLAAPLWAGMAAAVNHYLAAHQQRPMGFAAPRLYQLAANPLTYTRDFHDVTSGDNGFAAGVGWDAVTGWGSPNLANLAADWAGSGVASWGSNILGQAGLGTISSGGCACVAPSQTLALTRAVALAGGEMHSLALQSDGTVWSWGSNNDGQLGILSFSPVNSPTPLQVVRSSGPLTDVVGIAAGGQHSLAVQVVPNAGPSDGTSVQGGTAWAWGYNQYGQLGVGTSGSGANLTAPTRVLSATGALTNVVAVAGGNVHSMALTADGTVWTWGQDALRQLGQLGPNTCTSLTFQYQCSTLAITIPDPGNPAQPFGSVVAIAAGAGGNHSLALQSDGSVWAWGDDRAGQAGQDPGTAAPCPQPGGATEPCVYTPTQIAALNGMTVTAIAAGDAHSLALTSDGLVYSWGANTCGQLGQGSVDNAAHPTPERIGILGIVVAIAAGDCYSLALTSDGTVWAWGTDSSGQLGDGTMGANNGAPTEVGHLSGVVGLAAGGSHALALGSVIAAPPTATPTSTAASSATPTATSTPTSTVTPSSTPTASRTASATPTATPGTPSATPTGTATAPTASATPTSTPAVLATPGLTLSPRQLSPQRSLTITGTTFGPGEAVKLYLDLTSTPPLTTVAAIALGSFVTTATITQAVAGPHAVVAVGQSTLLTASAPLTIVPSLAVTPASAVAGSVVRASGYGFGKSESVRVYWEPGNMPLGRATTNGLGSFAGQMALSLTVPLSPTGSYSIKAIGQSSGATASSHFTIATPAPTRTPTTMPTATSTPSATPTPSIKATATPVHHTVTWVAPTSGDWSNPTNWSGGVLPGPGDSVVITTTNITVTHSQGGDTIYSLSATSPLVLAGGSLSIAAPSTLAGGLTINGPSAVLDGAGSLSVTGPLTWTDGSMTGSGAVTASGGLVLSGTNMLGLHRPLTNSAMATWSGSGSVAGYDGLFVNAGTLQTQAGSGALTLQTPFSNTGSVTLQSGTLALDLGGSSTGPIAGAQGTMLLFGAGVFAANAPASINVPVLDFAGTNGTATSFNPGVTLGSIAAMTVTGGAVTLNTGHPVSIASLSLAGALGGSDNLSISNLTWWGQGSLNGPGTTTLLGQSTVSDYPGLGGPLVNQGTLALATSLNAGPGGAMTNTAGALLDVQGDETLSGPLLVNAGTLRKSAGSGILTLQAPFTNTGTVQIQSGTLELLGSGTISSGSITGTVGTTLEIAGVHTFSGSASFSVPNLVFAPTNSTVTTFSQGFDPASLAAARTVTIEGGAVTLNTGHPVSIASLSLAGALGGSDNLSISNLTWWGQGSLNGPGTTTLLGQSTVSDYPGLGGPLVNQGTLAATTSLNAGPGGVITNSVGALFDVQGDETLSGPGFVNAGTLRKSAGSGTLTWAEPVTNTGLVQVQSGTLDLAGNGGSSSGSMTGTVGTILEFGGGHVFTLSAGAAITVPTLLVALAGNGSITPASSVTAASGSSLAVTAMTLRSGMLALATGRPIALPSVTLSGGWLGGSDPVSVTTALTWTSGAIATAGGVTSTGQLTINGTAGAGGFYVPGMTLAGSSLVNVGTAIWSSMGGGDGGGDIAAYNGAVLHNTGTISATGDGALTWCQLFSSPDGSVACQPSGAQPTFVNDGALVKTAGHSATTFAGSVGSSAVAVVNRGTIETDSGVLAFGPTYTQSAGVLRLNGGGVTSAGTLSIGGGRLSGSGAIVGNVALSGQLDLGPVVGTLSITGVYTQAATGTLTLKLGGSTPGTYDQLAVSGQATLDGTLALNRVNGYAPAVGDSLGVMTCGSCGGQFATVIGTSIDASKHFAVAYSGNAVTLTVQSGTAHRLGWPPGAVPRTRAHLGKGPGVPPATIRRAPSPIRRSPAARRVGGSKRGA